MPAIIPNVKQSIYYASIQIDPNPWLSELSFTQNNYNSAHVMQIYLIFIVHLKVLFIAAAMATKWKRTVLSIKDKVDILKLTVTTLIAIVAEWYGIRKSTISDIKKNREKILRFQQEMTDMEMKTAKVMKLGDNEQHDKAVYLWFKQKQMEGTSISRPILSEKVKQLHITMIGDDSSFSGSTGWQWIFCNDTEYALFCCKERSSLLILQLLTNSSRHSVPC